MELPPELLAQIQAGIANGTINLGNTTGRSPIRPRQLNDLRLLPTKDDPRPTFFWSAESPRDVMGDLSKGTPYPRLLWDAQGTEITVHDEKDHQAKMAEGYLELPPSVDIRSEMDALQDELSALSPEEQALVLEGQKQHRIDALKKRISALPDSDVETLTSTEPRKRGRPRKTA